MLTGTSHRLPAVLPPPDECAALVSWQRPLQEVAHAAATQQLGAGPQLLAAAGRCRQATGWEGLVYSQEGDGASVWHAGLQTWIGERAC
jgi:hypothetical protein